MADDFDCAVCRTRVCMRWSYGRGIDPIPPLCRWCERAYGGKGTNQSAGSFRDRREVIRGLALSEALHSEAVRKTWEPYYAAT